ncbi:MAG: hypothetical protein RLZZ255_1363, partial [Cyanobacteriota bacterium]
MTMKTWLPISAALWMGLNGVGLLVPLRAATPLPEAV